MIKKTTILTGALLLIGAVSMKAWQGEVTIETPNSQLLLTAQEGSDLRQLYYGDKSATIQQLRDAGAASNFEAMPAFGSVDPVHLPALHVQHMDGDQNLELQVADYSHSDDGKAIVHVFTMKDKLLPVTVKLFYKAYKQVDVIEAWTQISHQEKKAVTLKRFDSGHLTLRQGDVWITHLHGNWGAEAEPTTEPLTMGLKTIRNSDGARNSHLDAPELILSLDGKPQELTGRTLGLALCWSGNFELRMNTVSHREHHIYAGIDPIASEYILEPKETFETPHLAMAYSAEGMSGVSRVFHNWARKEGMFHRGMQAGDILLNSWEGIYLDITEDKIIKMMDDIAAFGGELFVMDDGWFGKRDDDTSSLGDWTENKKKLPNGLQGLAKKVNALGMQFGIWVEPEMVNMDSELYRTHPEWVMEIPGKAHSEGRNQRVLDLSNPEVQQYIIEEMKRVFSSANIAYVKWDMNRVFSDVYSQALPKEQQGEVAHRYQMGLYHCMQELTQAFPEILFEGCASGGNRFDLGILCYFPQIWASDNTDAMCRAEIQNGYSYGYPQSVMGAHVSSCPNHQTLRVTPLDTRFAVAAFGVLGYECNLCDAKKEDLETIKAQIELYKHWRGVLQFGQWIRGKSFAEGGMKWGGVSNLWDGAGNLQEWYCVSEDQSREIIVLLQRFAIPNNHSHRLRAKALAPDKIYRFTNRELKHNIKSFGDLVNTQAPIHIKQDSLLHNVVAKFVKMDGETENYLMRGDVLMHGGVHLKQPYGGTGYNDQVRFFPDFGARMYFVEEETGNENT